LSARESWDAGAASSFAKTRLSFPFDHYDIESIGDFRFERLSSVSLTALQQAGRNVLFGGEGSVQHSTGGGASPVGHKASGLLCDLSPPNRNLENIEAIGIGLADGWRGA
jgi:hypothetical protein